MRDKARGFPMSKAVLSVLRDEARRIARGAKAEDKPFAYAMAQFLSDHDAVLRALRANGLAADPDDYPRPDADGAL
jgi:hypothetical protein